MVDNFLFHKVSEKEKKEIRKQAKQIMDNFSRMLSELEKACEEAPKGDRLVNRVAGLIKALKDYDVASLAVTREIKNLQGEL